MYLGIDFGTCYSSAALIIDQQFKLVKEPLKLGYTFASSVFVEANGKVHIGQAAENQRSKDVTAYRRHIKKDLGQQIPIELAGKKFQPEDLVAAILAGLRTEAEAMVSQKIQQAVITIPATYQGYRAKCMQVAAEQAGFTQVDFLAEPIAAAIYHDHPSSGAKPLAKGEILLVYDLGGGTFDAALLEKQGEGYTLLAQPIGHEALGGSDFDREIYRNLNSRCDSEVKALLDPSNQEPKAYRARVKLQDWIQPFKHQLSVVDQYSDDIPINFEHYDLTRRQFEQMIDPYIQTSLELCQELIKSAGVKWADVSRILMVGGSCRIPYVRKSIEQRFQRPLVLVDEPELAVCLGAVLSAQQMQAKAAAAARAQAEAEARQRAEVERMAREREELAQERERIARDREKLRQEQERAKPRFESFRESVAGVAIEMIAIPAGKFLMGSPESEAERDSDEGPQHWVTLKGFYLGKYPVTQKQYEAIMGNNPSSFKGGNRPVENVNWHEAQAFCQTLSARTGKHYRLPSEAEWEYACRAGTTTPFHYGETLNTQLANYDGNYTYGNGIKGLYRQQTTEVGSFPANRWGLHDMHGNVWEWCEDVWYDNYSGAPSDGSARKTNSTSKSRRLLRGGSWCYRPWNCRSANRYWNYADLRHGHFGFRVALSSLPGSS